MKKYDVAIIGSGMGGSIASIILSKLGHKVILIERGEHPRFALGESSTPIMSKKLRFLGKEYDIPEFVEMSSYDSIKEKGHDFLCAPKELFHYFLHKPGQTKAKEDGDTDYPEILVQTPEVDTQFYRADYDQYIVKLAEKYGVNYVDHTEVLDFDDMEDCVHLKLKQDNQEKTIESKFIIDATGFRSFMGSKYDLKVKEEDLDTPLRSRSIFTHFKTVGTLESAVSEDEVFAKRSPIDRIRATQHHCFEGGWIWFIPFDNGVTSVGMNLDMDKYPINDLSGEDEFWSIVNKYPIIRNMLEGHETSFPFIKTGRIQFKTKQAVGDRWALLPAAAVGGDGWFSTGLGLTLMAIHRLVDTLDKKMLRENNFSREMLLPYEEDLYKEWKYSTRMINGIYKSFKHFEVFKHYCFLCFMGAESFVHSGGVKKASDSKYLLLNVGNKAFIDKFEEFYDKVIMLHDKDEVSKDEAEELAHFLLNDMKEYNFRNYGDPSFHGIHEKVGHDSPFYNTY